MADIARIRDIVPDCVFRRGYTHRVIPHPRIQADYRSRHVAFNAEAASALRRMMSVRRNVRRNLRVAARAKCIVAWAGPRIVLDIGAVRMRVAGGARRASLQKT